MKDFKPLLYVIHFSTFERKTQMIVWATVFSVTNLSLFYLIISLHSIGGDHVVVSQQTKTDHERIRVNTELVKKVDQDITKLRDDREQTADDTNYCTENPDEPECNSKSPSDEDETIT